MQSSILTDCATAWNAIVPQALHDIAVDKAKACTSDSSDIAQVGLSSTETATPALLSALSWGTAKATPSEAAQPSTGCPAPAPVAQPSTGCPAPDAGVADAARLVAKAAASNVTRFAALPFGVVAKAAASAQVQADAARLCCIMRQYPIKPHLNDTGGYGFTHPYDNDFPAKHWDIISEFSRLFFSPAGEIILQKYGHHMRVLPSPCQPDSEAEATPGLPASTDLQGGPACPS